MKATRVIICAKDVQCITGKSYRSACHLLKKIKTHYNKPDHQFITTSEFCTYTGITPEAITHHIQ